MALLVAAALSGGCGPDDRTPSGLYRYYCARCHGSDGRGDPRRLEKYPELDLTSSPMVMEGRRHDVRERIVEGYGPMPAYERKLTSDEIDALAAHTIAEFGPPPLASDGRRVAAPSTSQGGAPSPPATPIEPSKEQ